MDNKELIDAIHRLEVAVTAKLTEHTTKLDNQCSKLDVLCTRVEQNQTTLYGMGGGKEGIVTKLSALETAEQNHKYTMRALFTMIVGIIGKIVYDLFQS